MKNKIDKINYQGLLAVVIFGLVLIGLLELASNLLLRNDIQYQDKIAHIINISGKQRMLTQKIASLSSQYLLGDAQAKENLLKTIKQYQEAHKLLSSSEIIAILPQNLAKQARKIYGAEDSNLNGMLENYCNHAKLLITLPQSSKEAHKISREIFEASVGIQFHLIDNVVSLYEEAAVDNKEYLQHIKNIFTTIVIFVLLFEFFILFLPAVMRVRYHYQNLMDIVLKDQLTSLGNRYFFYQKVSKSISIASKSNRMLAVFYIDLDNFKDINDAHGTAVGDLLIKEISRRLKSISRGGDTLARLGGDDFALLVENINNSSNLSLIAERYLKSFSFPFKIKNKSINISISLGIALYPKYAKNTDELMRRADTALHKAKMLGKNKYAFYSDILHKQSLRRSQIDTALQLAIERSEFRLHYQPQVDCNNNKVVGVEALIRWENEELENPSPLEFIPVAESSNYIFKLSQWVLEQALNDLSIIQEKFNQPNFKMSINLSGKEFFNEKFMSDKLSIIDRYSSLTNNLIFEVTETALIKDISHAQKQLKQLADKGIKIALDDFGTGYSSLKYLKQLPISIVKIDGSFIREIEIEASNMEIIKAITNLSKALNFNLVGEGVETFEQLQFMQKNGCSVIQGYYFARPMELKKLMLFMKSKKEIKNEGGKQ